jgi:alpha/beta superfamily hydrolase
VSIVPTDPNRDLYEELSTITVKLRTPAGRVERRRFVQAFMADRGAFILVCEPKPRAHGRRQEHWFQKGTVVEIVRTFALDD